MRKMDNFGRRCKVWDTDWRGNHPAGGRDRLWDTIWHVTRNYETIYLWLTKDRANKDRLNNKGLDSSIMRILSLRQTFMVFDLWIMLSAHRETLNPPSGFHLRDKFHSICLYSNSKWFWTWFNILPFPIRSISSWFCLLNEAYASIFIKNIMLQKIIIWIFLTIIKNGFVFS